jgi:hypothetical protein
MKQVFVVLKSRIWEILWVLTTIEDVCLQKEPILCGIMGLTSHPCNFSILVFIDIVSLLSDHALHLFRSYSLLSARVLLFETIFDAMMCNFPQHGIEIHLNVSWSLEVTARQFLIQERYWTGGWECVVCRKAPWCHTWEIVVVQAAINVPEQCHAGAPSLSSLTLQDAQINYLLCVL